MKNFLDLAKSRYSVRKFSEGAIPREDVEKILEAGRAAPTAVNFQPIHFWVFESKEARDKLVGCTKMKFIAPAGVIIAVGAKKEGAWVRPFDGKNFAENDAAIAATHMILEIHDLGYGSTWIGHFDAAKVQELFPETAGYELIALLPVGHIAPDAAPSDRHEKRVPMGEIASFY